MYLFNPDCCREGKPSSAREGLPQREHSSRSPGSKPSGTLGSRWRCGASTMLCFIPASSKAHSVAWQTAAPWTGLGCHLGMAGRPCECETSAASQFHNEARCAETRLLHKRIQEPIIPAMNPCSLGAQTACRSHMMANLTPHEGVFVLCTKCSNSDGSIGGTSTEQIMD